MLTYAKSRRGMLIGLALLLILGTAWAYGSFRPDPKVIEARRLRDQLSAAAGKQLPPEKRQELWKSFNTQVRQLSPAQREELLKGRSGGFQDRISKYFQTPNTQRAAFLDAEINRSEGMRKEREKGKQSGAPPAASRQPPSGKAKTAEERDKRKRERLDQSTPEQRAMAAEYFKALNQRRQQRGLGPAGAPGGKR